MDGIAKGTASTGASVSSGLAVPSGWCATPEERSCALDLEESHDADAVAAPCSVHVFDASGDVASEGHTASADTAVRVGGLGLAVATGSLDSARLQTDAVGTKGEVDKTSVVHCLPVRPNRAHR